MLTKANMSWSCKQVAKMAENGTFKFDNVIQRAYVWEQTRKSELIHSIIEGYPIPPFYAKRVDGKSYDFLDGKQRIEAIRGFINNEYYLKGIPNVEIEDEDSGETETVSFEGMKFDDLPEIVQDRIKDYHITVYYYDGITDEEVRTMFKKLNNGKPLSAKDKNIASCVDIKTVAEIGEHDVFKNILTEKSLAARKHLPTVMKIWEMMYKEIDDVSFASKDFNEVISLIKIEDGEKEEIEKVLDKFYASLVLIPEKVETLDARLIKRRIGTETHFVSLIPFVRKAIEMDMSDDKLADFFVYAFGGEVVVSSAYTTAATSGSNKNVNIQIRNEEIKQKWNEFMKKGDE